MGNKALFNKKQYINALQVFYKYTSILNWQI